MQASPYNFDLNMSQCSSFDKLGMSLSYQSAHNDLGLKGIQNESLGYLMLSHTLAHGTYDSILKPVFTKYQKFE